MLGFASISSCLYVIQPTLQQINSDKSNRWSFGLSLRAVGAISNSPSSTTLLITRVPWRIFSKTTVCAYKNGLCEQNYALLEMICRPFGKIWCQITRRRLQFVNFNVAEVCT